MILATLGTHPARMRGVEDALGAWSGRERVVLQAAADGAPAGVECVGIVGPSRLHALLAEARLVVCHAGPATVFECWEAGHRPMVVPRDPSRSEHVDDHQQRFMRRLPSGLITAVDPGGLVASFERTPPRLQARVQGSPAFTRDFAALVDEVVAERRASVLRALLQHARRWTDLRP